jgi:hypothetical protein
LVKGDFEMIPSPISNGASKRGADPSFFFFPLSSRLPKNLFGEQVILPRKERGFTLKG